MESAFRYYILSVLLLITSISPVLLFSDYTEGYSNPYLFDEAVDIFYDTDLRSGNSLDNANSRNVYRINNLVGDELNGQENAHRFTVGIIKDSGANIKGIFYEPNGRPIGTMYSEGERSEIEFYIPYDGNYYLEVITDPIGSSAEYSYQLGGTENSNNNKYIADNKPGMTSLPSKSTGNDLHPTHDIVDYFQYDLQPSRSMEIWLVTEATFKLDILNSTQDLVGTLDVEEKMTITNDGGLARRYFFRVYFDLDGNTVYAPVFSSYTLYVDIWSHTTIPKINGSDPWPNTFTIKEDTELIPWLSLTSHFIETGGDGLAFEITSENENIDIMFNETPIGTGDNIWMFTEVRLIPEKNWHGQEVISFRATDRDGAVTDSFTLMVQEVNDPPRITKIGESDHTGGIFNIYGLEDLVRVYKINYTDEDDPFENLFFTTNASASNMPFLEVHPNGTIVVSPLQDDVGNYLFNITLEDGRGGHYILDVALAVESVNDVPLIPTITIVEGNMTLLPGEMITLEAGNVVDVDDDDLDIEWDWGDEKTSSGKVASHTYSTSHSGNTTITLTVSDHFLSSSTDITIFVESPEDIAKGELIRTVHDPEADSVKTMEEWRLKGEEKRIFSVSTVSERGLDILSLRTQRRGNTIQIFMDIKDTIQIDGNFQYHIFVMKKGYNETHVDFKNISSWESIPDRIPNTDMVLASRSYVGDPFIHNTSTGIIMNKATLVWAIPFTELVENGLEFPIDPDDFDLFAVSIHILGHREIGVLAERYIITDTAGEGALDVGTILQLDNNTGSSSSTFGDFARPTNILVVIGILIVLIIFGVAGFVLVKKQMKEKKQKEMEFIERIEKLHAEGKDPFGKDLKDEESPRKASYESLYGAPKPAGHLEKKTDVSAQPLPGPGLGGPLEAQSHIEELEIKNN